MLPDQQHQQQQIRILCYGDSLTAGTSDSFYELYPYAPHLEQTLNAKQQNDSDNPQISYVVRHRGLPGWTADAMLNAADDAQCGLRSAIGAVQNPSLSCVIILAGTNDLGMMGSYPEDERASKIVAQIKALHEMAWDEGVPKTIAVAVPPSGYQAQVSEAAALAEQVNVELKRF
ncbi:MAG: hypothetical protein SGARI_001993, partial [Bacillariaceae sp.]